MKPLYLSLLIVIFSVSASAAIVNVDSQDWDVTLVFGTFSELNSDGLLESQPWHHASDPFYTMQEFVYAVGWEGVNLGGIMGPAFTISDLTGDVTVYSLIGTAGSNSFVTGSLDKFMPLHFAVAIPVPLPASGIVFLSGLGLLGLFRRLST